MAMDPRARAESLIAARDLDGFAAATSEIERSLNGAIAGYRAWIAATIEFVASVTPADLPALIASVRDFFARYPGDGDGEEPPSITADQVAAIARAGDHAGALARHGEMLDAWRALHDLYRDWVSAVLSFVYREQGADALEQALRHGGEKTLLAWMDTDISRSPAKRLISAAHDARPLHDVHARRRRREVHRGPGAVRELLASDPRRPLRTAPRSRGGTRCASGDRRTHRCAHLPRARPGDAPAHATRAHRRSLAAAALPARNEYRALRCVPLQGPYDPRANIAAAEAGWEI